jgi:hypothetical protein
MDLLVSDVFHLKSVVMLEETDDKINHLSQSNSLTAVMMREKTCDSKSQDLALKNAMKYGPKSSL